MPDKLRVLFVDDERHVLDGLRNLLRRDRARWDMAFAEGAQAALEKLREGPFDLVVCDMRMPGIDGPALLEKIKTDHPATLRVVLSGHAERQAVLRAVPVAQQFLSKPCSEANLRRTIERAERTTRLVADLSLRVLIGGLHTLPTPFELHSRLASALAGGSVAVVAAVVGEDPALSAKVLQLANWECFSAGRTTSSVEEAVRILGLELVGTLVRVPDGEAPSGDSAANLSRLQQAGKVSARLARKLVLDEARAGQAFAAGLLHDVAALALVGAPAPVEWAQMPSDGGLAEVAGYLLTVWGLPEVVVDAVLHHRLPSGSGRFEFEILGAVHVAICVAKDCLARSAATTAVVGLDAGYLEALGLSAQLPAWRALAEAEVGASLTERPPVEAPEMKTEIVSRESVEAS